MTAADTFAPIHPLLSTDADSTLHRALIHRMDGKTKPPGSLGRLEELALQMGMIQQTITPQVTRPVINVLSRVCGVSLEIVNACVAGEARATENLINIPVGRGTRNFAYEAAMTREETQIALARGAARIAV